MKKYISIILIVIMTLLPVCVYADTNEESIIVCANPADYDEMTGVWNTDGLQTNFSPGNGDYPTLSWFSNEAGTETYSVDLGNKAGFYKSITDGNSFYAGFWVRLRGFNTGSNFNIYAVEGSTSHHRAFIRYNSTTNVIKIEYYNGTNLCTSKELSAEYANKWVYLGFAREVGTSETKCTIYVNGKAVASGTSSFVNTGEATLSIATAKNPAYYGSESLGEVEVLSQIPSDSEILKKYTDSEKKYKATEQNGKIFSLNMTEEENTTEKANGAYIGTYTYSYDMTEQALILHEESYVKAESESLIYGNDMTWELWISADTNGSGKIFAMGDKDNPEAHAFLQEGKVIFRPGRYDETYISSAVCEIEANKLYHLVFSRSYFESEGKGYFKYSAYCNSERIQGFPIVRYGVKPSGQKTAMYIGGGISAEILNFNVYNELISPDNIRKMYLKTVRPTDVSPNFGKKNVSINSNNIELKYDFPVTEEMLELQNITVKKGDQQIKTVNTLQGNKLILSVADGMKFSSVYSVYSGDKKLTEFETISEAQYEDYIKKYVYDFETATTTPTLKWHQTPIKSSVTFETNPATGSKAMKFKGVNGEVTDFSIVLPEEVTTRYALVKMKATPAYMESTMHMYRAPKILSEAGYESVRFAYNNTWPRVVYGSNALTYTNIASRNVTQDTIAAGRTDEFEALLDFKEKTVVLTTPSGSEVTGAFVEEASGIKELHFNVNTGCLNQVIYYDDIEIIGFNDPAVIEPVSYTITGITSGNEEITSLGQAAGKTIDISIEKTGIVTLIGAIYDGNTLVDVAVYSDGSIVLDVPKDAQTKAYTTKLFAWNSLMDIAPVMETKPFF